MSTDRRGAARLSAALLVALTAVALAPAARAAAAPAAPSATGTLAASRFVVLSPTRVYDSGAGAVGTAPVDLPLPAAVPATATAVVINLTGDRPSSLTNVAAYPYGGPAGTTSALNLTAGSTSADEVTVALPAGSDGTIVLHNAAGRIRLIVDLAGYYTADGSGAPFVPVQPYRAYDSRGSAPLGTSPTTIAAAALRVPTTATALVADLVAIGPNQLTNLAVWPAGTSKPTVSNLNVARGDTRANLVTVALGTDGAGIALATATGTTPYLLDVEGWFSPTATGALYTPLAAPTRIFGATARPTVGTAPFDLALPSPVPPTATAATFTLTVAHSTAGADNVAAYPPSSTALTSNVNVDRDLDTPNLVVSSLGASSSAVTADASTLTPTTSSATAVRLANRAGTAQLVVDLQGWFVPVAPGHDVSYAQCSGTGTTPSPLPAATFGIVNPTAGGLAGSAASSCLAAEDAWAAGTGAEAFYLPLVDLGAHSDLYRDPTSTPEPCATGQTAAAYDQDPGCAYDYGYDQAALAYSLVQQHTAHASGSTWWLDVEDQADDWSDGATPMSESQNVQVVQGALDSLASVGAASRGLYSNTDDVDGDRNWPAIIGATGAFAALPEWVSSHGTTALGAARACAAPFAGGPVTTAQAVGTDGALDLDVRC